ncbi:hypothetical protein EHR04_10855 [Leptospira levettii]|nr:hypothetical protein EHQ75_09780 [Leptospira levettii]TGM77468.1 hypothetical protein EHR04_10855 [Leptospira levettii]
MVSNLIIQFYFK